VTNVKIFVEGPYGSDSAAAQAANSLQGVETATAGGLYMVSAPLAANVQALVQVVADCLSRATGSGTLPGG
jgi:hypothetical protein